MKKSFHLPTWGQVKGFWGSLVTSQHGGKKEAHTWTSEVWETSRKLRPRPHYSFKFSTHTEAQRCAGLSVPGPKDQGPLAGMHVPTAGVARPAQWRVIGIKGAWQRILNRGRHGTASTNRHQRRPCNPPNKFKQKRQQKCWHTHAVNETHFESSGLVCCVGFHPHKNVTSTKYLSFWLHLTS